MERVNFRAEFDMKGDFPGYRVARRLADDKLFIAQVSILQKITKHIKRKNDTYRAMKEFSHPNILKLEHWYDDGQISFQLFEYCPCNLPSHCKQNPLTECQAVSATIQIAKGLQYIHSKGHYARLLSISSIFVQETTPGNAHYKLGMLSCLKLQEHTSRTSYSHAPELLLGNRQVKNTAQEQLDVLAQISAGPHTDLFSLGVIFFELLTKTPLFPDIEAIEALDKTPFMSYLKQRFPETEDQIDPGLLKILASLIVYDKSARIGAAQLIEALESIHKLLLQRPGQKQIYGQGLLFYELAKLIELEKSLNQQAMQYALHQMYKIFWLHTQYLKIQYLPDIREKLLEVEKKIQDFQGKQLNDKKLQKHAKTAELQNWEYQHPASLTGAAIHRIKNNQKALSNPYKQLTQKSLSPRIALTLILGMSFRKNVLEQMAQVNELYAKGLLLKWVQNTQPQVVKELALRIENTYFK